MLLPAKVTQSPFWKGCNVRAIVVKAQSIIMASENLFFIIIRLICRYIYCKDTYLFGSKE